MFAKSPGELYPFGQTGKPLVTSRSSNPKVCISCMQQCCACICVTPRVSNRSQTQSVHRLHEAVLCMCMPSSVDGMHKGCTPADARGRLCLRHQLMRVGHFDCHTPRWPHQLMRVGHFDCHTPRWPHQLMRVGHFDCHTPRWPHQLMRLRGGRLCFARGSAAGLRKILCRREAMALPLMISST